MATIELDALDRIRAYTNNKRVCVDLESHKDQTCISVDIYSMYICQMRKKTDFKLFVFKTQQELDEFDFGYWSDGEIVWNYKRK